MIKKILNLQKKKKKGKTKKTTEDKNIRRTKIASQNKKYSIRQYHELLPIARTRIKITLKAFAMQAQNISCGHNRN